MKRCELGLGVLLLFFFSFFPWKLSLRANPLLARTSFTISACQGLAGLNACHQRSVAVKAANGILSRKTENDGMIRSED